MILRGPDVSAEVDTIQPEALEVDVLDATALDSCEVDKGGVGVEALRYHRPEQLQVADSDAGNEGARVRAKALQRRSGRGERPNDGRLALSEEVGVGRKLGDVDVVGAGRDEHPLASGEGQDEVSRQV